MTLCNEKHFDVLPLLSLNLFCGIRPSEAQRLRTSTNRRENNFDWEDKEVRFEAKKTKAKMPRIVSMSNNCIAWLICHEKLQLPIANANHKWSEFLKEAKINLDTIFGRTTAFVIRFALIFYASAKTLAW